MKQRLYKLLMLEHRAMLDACYRRVFFSDGSVVPIKTFDDCLTDFYLYLIEAKPKYVDSEYEGYYLQQLRDEKALPKWLQMTFQRFILHEHKILTELQKALAEYRQQLANQRPGETLDITLMHVAFALAWFNQHESVSDRYLFFRSAFKHFSGFYEWPDSELNDAEIAKILLLTPANLRTRTSRLTAKVRRLVNELNDADIAGLNRSSLDIAHSIYKEPDPDIESILRDLLDKAERELPQYAEILDMRRRKRGSMCPLPSFSLCEDSCMPERKEPSVGSYRMDDTYDHVESNLFSCAISDDVRLFEESASRENRVVRLFKAFIGL